ncbi:MAG: DUF438 domain-containing protein [Flavobacteriaceae bacterium]
MNALLPEIDQLPKEHPISIYYQERDMIQTLLLELSEVNIEDEFQKYFNIFNQLTTIETRFLRKENQLFPYLEKYGWTKPSQGMWSFHDNLRAQIRFLHKHNADKNLSKITENLPYLIEGIKRLLHIEDLKLFPNALELLTEEDWNEFYEGDKEIGWMLREEPMTYPKPEYIHPSEDFEPRELPLITTENFHYDEGYMTPEQVNLLLKFLPIDITYVDEHDKVIFYNRGEERVFPRSKGIIGREVKFCHPPKSVDTVLKILKEFKAGTKDNAEFWLNYRNQVIHIRYFAIRDEHKNYKGVIEMSQDITEIQKLSGEKRLLDWN